MTRAYMLHPAHWALKKSRRCPLKRPERLTDRQRLRLRDLLRYNLQSARTVPNHRELPLNYFRARKEFSRGVIEGLNNKAKVTMRKAYGYRRVSGEPYGEVSRGQCRTAMLRLAPDRCASPKKNRGPEAAVSMAMPMGYTGPTNYGVTV